MDNTQHPGHRVSIWIPIVAGVLILALGGYWLATKNIRREGGSTNATSQNSGDNESVGGNKADANGLVSAKALECLPRGHDYYRTNHTLAVDPKDANIVYVGVEYKGVFKTTDGGTTWQQSDTGIRGYPKEANASQKCIQELGRTVIDPTDNKHLLISRVESPGDLSTLFSENAGLWESKDAGATWSQLVKKGMNASGSQAIAFDPKDPKTIYYGTNNMTPSYTDGSGNKKLTTYFNKDGILYQSGDAGTNWKELSTGAHHGFRAVNVAVDPTNSQKLWLFTFTSDEHGGTADDSTQKVALVSTDKGKSWTSLADKLPSGYKVLVDGMLSSKNGNNAFLITQTTTSAPKSFATTDGGTSFKASNTYMLAAEYDPNDATGMRMLGYAPYDSSPGIFQSTDGGVTWAKFGNLPSEVDGKGDFGVRVSSFSWSTSSPQTVYMSGSGGYVWKSTDNGKTWATVLTLSKIGGENKGKDGTSKSREQDPSSRSGSESGSSSQGSNGN